MKGKPQTLSDSHSTHSTKHSRPRMRAERERERESTAQQGRSVLGPGFSLALSAPCVSGEGLSSGDSAGETDTEGKGRERGILLITIRSLFSENVIRFN